MPGARPWRASSGNETLFDPSLPSPEKANVSRQVDMAGGGDAVMP